MMSWSVKPSASAIPYNLTRNPRSLHIHTHTHARTHTQPHHRTVTCMSLIYKHAGQGYRRTCTCTSSAVLTFSMVMVGLVSTCMQVSWRLCAGRLTYTHTHTHTPTHTPYCRHGHRSVLDSLCLFVLSPLSRMCCTAAKACLRACKGRSKDIKAACSHADLLVCYSRCLGILWQLHAHVCMCIHT